MGMRKKLRQALLKGLYREPPLGEWTKWKKDRTVSEIHDRSRLTSSESSLCLKFLKSKDILVKS